MPEPALNPETSTAVQTMSGKIKPPTLTPKPTEAMQDNTTLPSDKESALAGNADGDEIIGSQWSKGV